MTKILCNIYVMCVPALCFAWPESLRVSPIIVKPPYGPTVEELQADIDAHQHEPFYWDGHYGTLSRFGGRWASTNDCVRAWDCVISNVLNGAYAKTNDDMKVYYSVTERYRWLLNFTTLSPVPISTNMLMRIADHLGKFELTDLSNQEENMRAAAARHHAQGGKGAGVEFYALRTMYMRRKRYNEDVVRERRSVFKCYYVHLFNLWCEHYGAAVETIWLEFLNRAKATEEDRRVIDEWKSKDRYWEDR